MQSSLPTPPSYTPRSLADPKLLLHMRISALLTITSFLLNYFLLLTRASTLCLQAVRNGAKVCAARSPFLVAKPSCWKVESVNLDDTNRMAQVNAEILRKQVMVNQMVNAVGCTPEQATTILQRAQWHLEVSSMSR